MRTSRFFVSCVLAALFTLNAFAVVEVYDSRYQAEVYAQYEYPDWPHGLTFDSDGNLYVGGDETLIKIAPDAFCLPPSYL